MTVCTFAGHREVLGSIDERLDLAIEEILQRDTEIVFYTGGMGEFDEKCASAVRKAKYRHPDLNIHLCLVLPYMMQKINKDKEYYESHYDSILIPSELETTHYKAAIPQRNRWLIDACDVLIAFVYRDFGGAYTTLKYAQRQGKTVINIAETQI